MLLLAVLAIAVRPPSPPPLTPEARWEISAAPRLGALARDVVSAGAATAWSPALTSRLKADLTRVGAAGSPPDPSKAAVWDRALRRVADAVSKGGRDSVSARSELRTAGLELTALSESPAGA